MKSNTIVVMLAFASLSFFNNDFADQALSEKYSVARALRSLKSPSWEKIRRAKQFLVSRKHLRCLKKGDNCTRGFRASLVLLDATIAALTGRQLYRWFNPKVQPKIVAQKEGLVGDLDELNATKDIIKALKKDQPEMAQNILVKRHPDLTLQSGGSQKAIVELGTDDYFEAPSFIIFAKNRIEQLDNDRTKQREYITFLLKLIDKGAGIPLTESIWANRKPFLNNVESVAHPSNAITNDFYEHYLQKATRDFPAAQKRLAQIFKEAKNHEKEGEAWQVWAHMQTGKMRSNEARKKIVQKAMRI